MNAQGGCGSVRVGMMHQQLEDCVWLRRPHLCVADSNMKFPFTFRAATHPSCMPHM